PAPVHCTLSLHDALPIFCTVWRSFRCKGLIIKGRFLKSEKIGAVLVLEFVASLWRIHKHWGLAANASKEIEWSAGGYARSSPAIDRKSTRLNSSHLGISY